MEKTVSVKTESDTVKVAVITTENKIVTDDKELSPADINDLQMGDDIESTEESQVASSPSLA
jgi:hypothetical protein